MPCYLYAVERKKNTPPVQFFEDFLFCLQRILDSFETISYSYMSTLFESINSINDELTRKIVSYSTFELDYYAKLS